MGNSSYIKKRENETVHEFNIRFDKTVGNIPEEIKPKDQAIIIHYLNAFEGWLGYHLKDKNLNDLKTTQFNAKMAEQNAASTGKQKNFDHFAPSTSRSDPKLRKHKEPVNELKESKVLKRRM